MILLPNNYLKVSINTRDLNHRSNIMAHIKTIFNIITPTFHLNIVNFHPSLQILEGFF